MWYPMPKTILKGRLLNWGHTKGIRLPTKEAARLAIPVGTEVRVTVVAASEHALHETMTFHGGPTDSLDHDRIFAEGWVKKRNTR